MSEKKAIMIIVVIFVFLIIIGYSYAYFSANITGSETTSTVIVNGGVMTVHYDNLSSEIVVNNIYPRAEEWVTKNFTVTCTNTTDLTMYYKIGLDISANTFPSGYLTFSLENTRAESGVPILDIDSRTISGAGNKWIGVGSFTTGSSQVHAYTLKIYFPDNGENQNDAQNSIFKAKIRIDESEDGSLVPLRNINITPRVLTDYDINYDACMDYVAENMFSGEITSEHLSSVHNLCSTGEDEGYTFEDMLSDNGINIEQAQQMGLLSNVVYDELDELLPGYEHTDGVYTYHYKQELEMSRDGYYWSDIDEDGWGVAVLNRELTSITEAPVTSINNIPIVSMSNCFSNMTLDTLDLSNFNTSNVINMSRMFNGSNIGVVDLTYLNTSSVTNMYYMFGSASINNYDFSSIDMSKVTNASYMFSSFHSDELYFTNKDFSNLVNSDGMVLGINTVHLEGSLIGANMSVSKIGSIGVRKLYLDNSVFLQRTDRVRLCTISSGTGENNDYTFLSLKNVDFSNLTTLEDSFYGCRAEIDFTGVNTSNIVITNSCHY